MVTHKLSSLGDERTLCGVVVFSRPKEDHVTLLRLNTSCPECSEKIKREDAMFKLIEDVDIDVIL